MTPDLVTLSCSNKNPWAALRDTHAALQAVKIRRKASKYATKEIRPEPKRGQALVWDFTPIIGAHPALITAEQFPVWAVHAEKPELHTQLRQLPNPSGWVHPRGATRRIQTLFGDILIFWRCSNSPRVRSTNISSPTGHNTSVLSSWKRRTTFSRNSLHIRNVTRDRHCDTRTLRAKPMTASTPTGDNRGANRP